MNIIYMILVLQINFISAIQIPIVVQTFPKSNSYCCHCPNIELECTFEGNPVLAYWTINGNTVRVTDTTSGHSVDMSEKGNLKLKVNNTKYSRDKTYTCIVEYSDGEEVSSIPFILPQAEDPEGSLELDIEAAQNVLNVMWNYKWPECRKYTVYLDDKEVRDCIRISHMNCTIDQLVAGVEYKITVYATEIDVSTINATRLATTLHEGTAICDTLPGICIWLPVVILVILLLLATAPVILCCWAIHKVKRHRAGAASKRDSNHDDAERKNTSDGSSEKPQLHCKITL